MAATHFLSKLIGETVVCGCGGDLIATLVDFEPPSCVLMTPPGLYVTYDSATIAGLNSVWPVTVVDADSWTFIADVPPPTAEGDLYLDEDCLSLDSTVTGITINFTIEKIFANYEVIGTYAGGEEVFNGTGALGAAIANTTPGGTGTVTLAIA